MNFTEQRQELTQRQTENSKGEAKIKQLIQTLDLRKDEAIERTFKVTFAEQAQMPRPAKPDLLTNCKA